ncbi:MAG: hypothetical protein HWN68_06625 [Desulfobacterales bacterium]|nr:hypothetical protein [Desulfobacterales bacterium]
MKTTDRGPISVTLTLLCSCLLFVSAIFFVTSHASAALTTKDVANRVKKSMDAGGPARDAVRAAVIFAIKKGMSPKDAAEAATKSAVEVAVASGLSTKDIARVTFACAQGAHAAAKRTGRNPEALADGVKSGASSAAKIHGLNRSTLLAAVDAGTKADVAMPPETYTPVSKSKGLWTWIK